MKTTMAKIWQPGMAAEDIGNRLILFRFYNNIDLRWVVDAGSWLFYHFLLVLHELQPGEDPTTVPLHFAEF